MCAFSLGHKIYFRNQKDFYFFCITHDGCVVKVGHIKFTFHACVPCLALMSLFYMHFASFSYVVHVVCELFIVFDHIILILKSNTFDCKD